MTSLPDATDRDILDHVRLSCVPGIGGKLRRMLLDRFGSPQAVFAARPKEITAVGRIGPTLAGTIAALANGPVADEVLDICRRRGVQLLVEGSDGYPAILSRIDDPPGLLFVRGELRPCDALAVSIVGARHATAYGKRVASQLASGLARAGYTVVSGLARGIDAAAHRGAIDAGGRTIAVLGTGVLNIYPPEHADLATEVIGHGAVVSEAPPLAEPHHQQAASVVQRRFARRQPGPRRADGARQEAPHVRAVAAHGLQGDRGRLPLRLAD